VAAGNSSLSYELSVDQYIYVWKTDQAWAGPYRQLVIQLKDGTRTGQILSSSEVKAGAMPAQQGLV